MYPNKKNYTAAATEINGVTKNEYLQTAAVP
jgi:hypothetical protein